MQTISRRQLVKDLNYLCDKLDDRYGINYGGCCYIAGLIAKYLEMLHISYELRISSYDWKDCESVINEINNRVINRYSEESITGENTCEHYYIHIKYIGSINTDRDRNYCYKFNNVEHSDIEWLYKCGCWNDCYDTRFNPVVGKIIKNFFKKYL